MELDKYDLRRKGITLVNTPGTLRVKPRLFADEYPITNSDRPVIRLTYNEKIETIREVNETPRRIAYFATLSRMPGDKMRTDLLVIESLYTKLDARDTGSGRLASRVAQYS